VKAVYEKKEVISKPEKKDNKGENKWLK
jgi:hypothetical protein